MNIDLLFAIYAFIFGALIGSFANVLIYRLPLGLNIVFPRSSCPQCHQKISWYQNIPIFSYLFLKGKCAHCKTKISVRYLAVEIIAGLASCLLFIQNNGNHPLVMYFFYFSIFIIFLCHFFIDLDHMILPDSLNLILAALFLSYALLNFTWQHWLGGLGLGVLFPYLVTWIYFKIKGLVGLGGGDIKLYGVLGIYLGPFGIVQNIFLSCLLGSIFGLIFILIGRMKKENPLPFGPFIILVAAIQIFFQDEFNRFLSLIL